MADLSVMRHGPARVRCVRIRAGRRREQAGTTARTGRAPGVRRRSPRPRGGDRAGPVRREGARGQEGRAGGDRRDARRALSCCGSSRSGWSRSSLWQLGEAIWGHRTIHGGKRALRVAINLAEAALFGVLAWSAGSIAAKGGSSTPSKSFTEVVIGLPGGPLLIGLAGFGLVVGACYAVYRGVTSAFVRELDLSGASPQQARWAIRLGRIGWAALGPGVRVPRRAVHRRGDDVQPGERRRPWTPGSARSRTSPTARR